MFDRFIRLAKARSALRAGRLAEAIQLAEDPLVKSDRRAAEIRQSACAAILARARSRAERGDVVDALADLDRLLQSVDMPEARQLADRLRRDVGEQRSAMAGKEKALRDAKRLAEQGQLAAAESACANVAGVAGLQAEARATTDFVAARRRRAVNHQAAAGKCLAAGDVDRAVAEYVQARSIDADGLDDRDLTGRLHTAAAARAAQAIGQALAAGDLPRAVRAYRERIAALPGIAEHAACKVATERLAQAAIAHLRDGNGTAMARELAALEPALVVAGTDVGAAAAALLRIDDLRARGQPGELAGALLAAAGVLHAAALQQEGERLEAAAIAAETAVGRARALAEKGDIGGARSELTAVLELWPLHDAARAEIDLLGRTAADRDKRLALAREAAKSGHLREASALALSLAEAGPAGDEPRLLLKEVRARMEMVTRGIDQVKSAMHGQQAATADGLRHLQRRIEELAKVQVDHEELQPLSAALGVEADGLLVFEAIQADLGKRALRVACQRFGELLALRPQLIAPERLDARLLAVADRLRQAAEEALAAGRLDEVDFCRAAVAEAAVAGSDLAARAAALGEAVERNRARAEALVAEARKRLAERDLAAAEGLLDAARQLWVDGGSARRLEDELRAVRAQEATLAHVAELTAERDFSGAQARMADLPPTPPMLRTRIFDMKQNLARAQGLEGAFLLRVDEGGEYLVLRGESISIGNVREGRTDLPVLAAIAGRHARIQRSVSFHGGLQDSIIAEGGEVRVGGTKVAQQTLHSGDRIQLGSALQCQYALPTSRSMTASLTLLAGFQVAGTDRILLLKDRGRDGRILLGPGKDVHVRVPAATGEVELFAHKTGQVRVRADAGGTIDGKPFSGEHPVAAGSTVTAMGISFVLLPWLRQ